MASQKLQEQNFTSVQWCSVPLDRTPGRVNMTQPQSDTWVQLLNPEEFSPLCHDEALVMCPISNWEWAAWIPGHGEAVISIDRFCFPVS